MNSKQRVIDAIHHKSTDRVAITFDAETEVYDMLYRHTQHKIKEALFDFLNVDTWMILPKNFQFYQDEEDKKVKRSIWGYLSQKTHYSGGYYNELVSSPLAGKDDIADIKNFPWPSSDVLGFDHFPEEARKQGHRAIIGVFTWGAYHIATHIRGLENLLTDFALRKNYAEYLINTIAEISLTSLDVLLDKYGEGIDIIYMADDYCSQQGPLFSPAIFKELVIPYLKQITRRVHKSGKKFLLHVCGAVRPLLSMIIEAGVDMLEPIQVRAVGMDPLELKREFGKDLCFYGGMDLQKILCQGTPDQVADEARRLIDVLGQDGGYIFGPGHTYIQIDAPVENILAMYHTASLHRNV